MTDPIWSQESELAVIGCLLLGASPEKAQRLAKQDFYDARLGDVFGTVAKMVEKRKPVDVITVFEAMKEDGMQPDLSLLNETTQTCNPANLVTYAKRVKELAGRRRLVELAYQSIELAHAGKLDEITSLFLAEQKNSITKQPKSLAELLMARAGAWEALERGEMDGARSTHIAGIDERLNGGFRPGNLVILAARPAVGKSSLAQFIGLEAAKDGQKVLFLSQEMTDEELADRAAASRGRIDHSRLVTGRMTRDDWSRAVEVLESQDLAGFYVDDQPALTLADVRAKAKQVPGLGLLILDYLQLCSGKGENRNSEIEQISRGLKALAKELGIVVIALSQLNRQVELRANKRPMIADLRDSGAIEQDADIIALMWPVRDLEAGRLIGLDLAKVRGGKTGEVALHFDGSMQRWGESSEELSQSQPQEARRARFD